MEFFDLEFRKLARAFQICRHRIAGSWILCNKVTSHNQTVLYSANENNLLHSKQTLSRGERKERVSLTLIKDPVEEGNFK